MIHLSKVLGPIDTFFKVMSNCLAWDRDGDGLIENGGTADQTYDVWVMSGARYRNLLPIICCTYIHVLMSCENHQE